MVEKFNWETALEGFDFNDRKLADILAEQYQIKKRIIELGTKLGEEMLRIQPYLMEADFEGQNTPVGPEFTLARNLQLEIDELTNRLHECELEIMSLEPPDHGPRTQN